MDNDYEVDVLVNLAGLIGVLIQRGQLSEAEELAIQLRNGISKRRSSSQKSEVD